MKRSQRGCIGCEAKAAGATSWQVAYILGHHQMAVLASDESEGDDVPDDKVCALHNRLGREAMAISFRIKGARGAEMIRLDALRSSCDPEKGGKSQ